MIGSHGTRKRCRTLKPEEVNQGNSQVRLSSLTTRLDKPAACHRRAGDQRNTSVQGFERTPDLRTLAEGGIFSFGATIMTLSDKPYFQVTMGPPDTNKFLRLDFSRVPAK